ncbi:MAG: putative YccA/Bax inhibitor family protein [Glaciecola sp.]|jgi:uncharacterized YccA/Bax inhibitor family protein
MSLFSSSNPTFGADTFKGINPSRDHSDVMTVSGAINKIAVLGLLVFGGALYTWNSLIELNEMSLVMPYMLVGGLGGFAIAMIIIFKKQWSMYLAPIYCLFEGLFLGALSSVMELTFPGIVMQALLITFGVLFGMLLLYRLKIIKVTEKFKMVVSSATIGIALIYFVSFIGSFFNFNVPLIHSSGTFGIVFSLIVIVVAALNLAMDFNFIEEGAKSKAPKYMEWYSAFGLMVTLIWLYIEILRLLAKLKRR